MTQKLIVFTPDEARAKRGATAEEMLYCPHCEEHRAVFLAVMSKTDRIVADDTIYDTIVLERWRCVNCWVAWVEKYAVQAPSRGVVKDIMALYNTSVEGE